MITKLPDHKIYFPAYGNCLSNNYHQNYGCLLTDIQLEDSLFDNCYNKDLNTESILPRSIIKL